MGVRKNYQQVKPASAAFQLMSPIEWSLGIIQDHNTSANYEMYLQVFAGKVCQEEDS